MRIMRFLVVATLLIVVVYRLSTERVNITDYVTKSTSSTQVKGTSGALASAAAKKLDANKDQVVMKSENDKALSAPYEKASATFVSLARNSDLWDLIDSIRMVEDRFNHRYHYDWVFLNDDEFTEEFKDTISRYVSGKATFGLIPKEHWGFPEWIDKEKAALVREQMRNDKVIYGDSIPYRHMCRYESGFFWRHPALDPYKFYWRVEPHIKLFCDIDYDVFKFMEEKKLKYGFTISLYEYETTIKTLWKTTKEFIDANPQYVSPNSLMDFISDDKGETYNRCHFWSNFEVASLDFWRGEAYQKYFEHLDKAGGFFYERWGDAPVHSLAASLFLDKDEVHYFQDIGYWHNPFSNCPTEKEERLRLKCTCNPARDHDNNFTWKDYSCTPKFFNAKGLQRPKGWEDQT
ncbi:alpha-1,2-mannosyltransferase KTR1 [Sugiyamaella lignohabitans]|uniref:Alpha-1,2-mannosyltransferase KTR1 n=1 Tax=Sugiyamaella lignohabitans TaxID=796027 RepID=A0A161HNS0_9ASCO|nr:alpha-1,2-mannosyltransferase KTR1 [Sugiyamaella lignohabitans]ANB15847.1 alpha-1,2-mannosyltransferase KTR1 [Sugiyamaella lignohabitans]